MDQPPGQTPIDPRQVVPPWSNPTPAAPPIPQPPEGTNPAFALSQPRPKNVAAIFLGLGLLAAIGVIVDSQNTIGEKEKALADSEFSKDFYERRTATLERELREARSAAEEAEDERDSARNERDDAARDERDKAQMKEWDFEREKQQLEYEVQRLQSALRYAESRAMFCKQ